MKYLLILSSLLFISLAQAQVVFDKTEYDFGELNGNDSRFVDIYLKNNTNKDAFILSVKKPIEVVYIQKSALIVPDSSSIIRFQINKKTKGKFSYSIPVYTSDKNEPTNIILKGKIASLPNRSSNFTACPDFRQSPGSGNPLDFVLTVRTIDKITGASLGKSKVAILQNGEALGKWNTSKNGNLKLKLPLGITYFYATHPGYYAAEKGMYVNFKRNFIELALIPKEEQQKQEVEKEQEESEKEEEIIAQIDNKQSSIDISELIEEEEEEETNSKDSAFAPPQFKDLDKDNFDASHFNPINVVFVIDVSSSMRQADRIELLKYSLDQLVQMLRPQDKIGLVSYSNDARVLLKPISGNRKNEISEEVKNLKAAGLTAGGAGIKLGYKQVRRNRIKEGQNHLIIITDGAFNKNSGDYKKYIKKNLRRKNITMSVVGIKSNEKSEENMREAAQLGNGRFILIEKLADAQSKLKQEIRLTSFKY
ncbi:hypothetical protein CW751_09340 [Brumimicrobium salinarum]|uniref:VWFA domain-containing protein n=1 Tax=Brumimicrobium salinarum TaxID=2058658 RepID=A0A2I0R1X1_9FLAO|nr:VWA domain-containing protein [Brumimicrobium salinarum]PKR80567.1 hypothetical protein CW751_09340 [Brumimicrobium salinarum]